LTAFATKYQVDMFDSHFAAKSYKKPSKISMWNTV